MAKKQKDSERICPSCKKGYVKYFRDGTYYCNKNCYKNYLKQKEEELNDNGNNKS